MPDTFHALLKAYMDAFGKPPLLPIGVTDDRIAELMRHALEAGTPIPEEAYHADLPPDAVA